MRKRVKPILRIFLHLFIIGLLFGPAMYLVDLSLGYFTIFPNSIAYYWLLYFGAFIFIALIVFLFYHGLVNAMEIKDKFYYKVLLITGLCFLASLFIYSHDTFRNDLKGLLVRGSIFSLLGFVYVLLESKTTLLKKSTNAS